MRQAVAINPASFSAAAARVGDERFGAALLEGLRAAAEIDFIALVTHRPTEGPRMLSVASRHDLDQAVGLTRAYVAKGYVHDPNHARLKRPGQCRKPLLLRHDERRLIEPRYRDYFFTAPGIVDKLSYLWCGGNTAYYVNLYRRRADGPFSAEEAKALDAIAPLLAPLVQKHDARSRLDAAMAGGDQRRIASELVGLLDAGLTPREEAVLARIVSGVSTEGIALDLNVKPSTVITLRKRGYAKLAIATQAELFARCLQALPKAYAPVTLQ